MNLPTEAELREGTIKAFYDIARIAGLHHMGLMPELGKVIQSPDKDPSNITRTIDISSAIRYKDFLTEKCGFDIDVYGEEEVVKPPENLADLDKLVAFVDPIDGTDLQVRGFSNWGSALIYFIPKRGEVVSCIVGHGSGDVFYSSGKGAIKRLWEPDDRKRGIDIKEFQVKCNTTNPVKLSEASICFYGQKPSSFLKVAKNPGFLREMKKFAKRMNPEPGSSRQGESLGIRLYNLGGNPMMVKVPSGAVDAVFSLSGAKAYDVIPGAYIAVQAGGVFIDMDGNDINFMDRLLRPDERVPYILAGSRGLAEELRGVLTFVT